MSDHPLRIVPNQSKPSETAEEATPALPEAPLGALVTDQEKLTELRRLLLAPEQQQLAQIQARLNDHKERVKDLSRALPAAIRARNAQDRALTAALTPNIGPALRQAIKNDPSAVIEAVTPVIGPAIRKAISHALNELVQSIDETLKHSVSMQGMKWRAEAFRTGRSFAEVVLYHTLVYRIEQAFLFHRKTGLLLAHADAPTAKAENPDLVSGLLTAINDLGRDSFQATEEQNLTKLDYGDLEVWIEGGAPPVELAYLAVVIRGNAPEGWRAEVLLPALEAIHSKQREALLDFDGDTGAFELSREYLEACLQSQYRGKSPVTDAPKGFRLPLTVSVPLAALLLLLAVWGFFDWRAQRRWNDYLAKLRTEPGLIVTEQGRSGSKLLGARFFIEGLRDPLATDPAAVLRQTPLDPAAVTSRWKPYHALELDFVQARAARVLEPPATVKLKVANDVLAASGLASQQWIENARRLTRALPGITRFDESSLRTAETQEQLQLKDEVEKSSLRFNPGTTQFAPGQEAALQSLANQVVRLFALASLTGKQPQLTIVGHTDAEGGETVNQRLSIERATRLLNALVANGVPRARLTAAGVGNSDPLRAENTEEDRQLNRRVSFQVELP